MKNDQMHLWVAFNDDCVNAFEKVLDFFLHTILGPRVTYTIASDLKNGHGTFITYGQMSYGLQYGAFVSLSRVSSF